MKTVLTIDGVGHDLEGLRDLLGQCGYNVSALAECSRQVEQALDASEKRYRHIFENAPHGIFCSTLEGKLLTANPALARIFRYDSPEQMMESVNRDGTSATVRSAENGWRDVLAGKMPSDAWEVFEERYRRSDGLPVDCCVRLRRVPDAPDRIEGFIEDITERKATENILRESETRFRRLMEILPIPAYTTDAEGWITFFNSSAAQLWGRKPTLHRDRWCGSYRLWHPDGRPMSFDDCPMAQTLKQGQRFHGHEVLIEQEQDGCSHVVAYPEPFYDQNGKLVGALNLLVDITARKRVEAQLRQANLVVENSPVVLFRWKAEPGWPVVLVSGNITQFGYEPREFLSEGLVFASIVHPDDRERVAREVEVYAARGVDRFEQVYRILGKGGKVCWVSDRTIVERDEEGCITHYQGIVIDITERKQAEECIKASLIEKEVLLKEIHHRVKNNLQVVSSLLYLQSQRLEDPEVKSLFAESESRIFSMALAHEQLYRSKNLADIDLPDYVHSLVAQIRQAFSPAESRVSCAVDVDKVVLDIEKVVPCGLLLTELLSNAFKHAFPGECRGNIQVAILQRAGGLRLSVCDDGIGLPEGFDCRKADTLGLQLVYALVGQLDGTLAVSKVGGTRFEVAFPGTKREAPI